MQGNTTGVICNVCTPRHKERYPSPLTTQYAQGLELHVGLVRLEDKEGNPCP